MPDSFLTRQRSRRPDLADIDLYAAVAFAWVVMGAVFVEAATR
jgi:hypothetical protein